MKGARKQSPSPTRGVGRPTTYTEALAEAICEAVADGKSVRTICAQAGMPGRSTVRDWLHAHPEFKGAMTYARECQGDLMDEKILEVAEACTPETANADRVKIDAYKWRAARLAPKRYGDKTAIVGGDPETDSPVQIVSDLDRMKAIGALVARVRLERG